VEANVKLAEPPSFSPGDQRSASHWLPAFLRPPPPAPPITDPLEIRRQYAHLRPRILFWTTIGYGTFYFVRKNLSIALPIMQDQLGLSKSSMGLILTLHGVLYGVSKFLNGVAADRANARLFMALALIISAGLNVCFGLSSALFFFGLFWMLNGWFQGMGYPPCARLLTHWFSPKELATKMAIWNASHTLGGSAIVILCGFLLHRYGNWRLCFFVPSIIALAVAGLLLVYLRDTPESVGLPEIEGTHMPGLTEAGDGQTQAQFKAFLWSRVFSNKYIWYVSAANFFVYTIRFAVFDWGTTLLKESKGIEILNSSLMIAAFEIAGLFGMLITGWLTDHVCGGRATPICLISMLMCGLSVFLFWKTPPHMPKTDTILLASVGFFVYCPQALVAVVVANLATKRAAATAVGLTSIFGYASTVLSGWGLGKLVQHYHTWAPAFASLIGIAVAGAILFAIALPAKANGYEETAQLA
jgi:phosphoglycerate transporter family protein